MKTVIAAILTAIVATSNAATPAAHSAFSMLKSAEGFSSTVYRDSRGVKTIGYGFTAPHLVSKGKMTRATADRELLRQCNALDSALAAEIKGLAVHERAALISFAYNVGLPKMRRSTLFRLLKNGVRGRRIAAEIAKWRYVRRNGRLVPCKGLQRRRAAEAAKFLGIAR